MKVISLNIEESILSEGSQMPMAPKTPEWPQTVALRHDPSVKN